MNPRALTLNEMLTYESVLEKYQDEIFSIPEVHGLGVGYRHRGRKLSQEIVLVTLVAPGCGNLPLKRKYGDVETQIIEMPKIDQESSKKKCLPWEDRFKYVNPIVGGIQIGNCNLCKYKSGVLGAIVFDQSGDPLGLSVQHAIGDHQSTRSTDCDCPVCTNATQKTTGAHTSWWVPQAAPGNAISQPNSFDSENEIGTLFKINRSLDAAIFKLNTKEGGRDIEARVDGIPGELNEPIKATLGTRCLFRGAKTHTEGRVWFVGKMKIDDESVRGLPETFGRKVDTRVQIGFEITGEHHTTGGDSGGLWVTEEGLHPVGLHTGQVAGFGYAVATSIQQLVNDFHPFTFSPIQYRTMLDKVRDSHTAFVDAPDGNGFFTFCVSTHRSEPVKIQKYDDRARLIGEEKSRSNIDALNGISAACLRGDVYAVWRSMTNDEIKVSQWDNRGNLKTYYGLSSYQTVFQPDLIEYQDQLLMAYVDRSFRIWLVNTDGSSWRFCSRQVSSGRSYQFGKSAISAPALARLGDRLFMAWVQQIGKGNDRHIKLMELRPRMGPNDLTDVVQTVTLPPKYYPKGNIDLAVSPLSEELVLAMTTYGGALVTIAAPLEKSLAENNWSETSVLSQDYVTENPPSLFCHDGRMICTREHMSK